MHMQNNQRHGQRGITFIGVLFIAAIIGFSLITGAKIVPSLLEYQAIVKAVEKAKGQQTSVISTSTDEPDERGLHQ